MVDCPRPSTTVPIDMVVLNGARPAPALARKTKVPALRGTVAEVLTRLDRLTAVVGVVSGATPVMPLLSRPRGAPGLTTKPAEPRAVPAATRDRVPALTTVLPV